MGFYAGPCPGGIRRGSNKPPFHPGQLRSPGFTPLAWLGNFVALLIWRSNITSANLRLITKSHGCDMNPFCTPCLLFVLHMRIYLWYLYGCNPPFERAAYGSAMCSSCATKYQKNCSQEVVACFFLGMISTREFHFILAYT